MRMKVSCFYILHQPVEVVIQMKSCFRCQGCSGHITIDRSTEADLLCDDRTDPGIGGIDCLCNGAGLCKHLREEFFFCRKKRIVLILCLRDKVSAPRKYLTDRTHLRGNMLDTVYDTIIFVTEDDIAVLAHQFDDQLFRAQVTQLIEVFDVKAEDTL